MQIALLGTRGIPNRYGGFEQFAEELSIRLAERGHRVWVFIPKKHPFGEPYYKGVELVRIGEPLQWMGPLHSLFYDLRCLKHAFQLQPDVVLLCGYGAAGFLKWVKNNHKIPVAIHMDGMEWQRKKWNLFSRIFLRWSEKQATSLANKMIVDSKMIQKYYQKKYGEIPCYIPYGADFTRESNEDITGILAEKNLVAGQFFLLVARLEPENNPDMIIRGYLDSGVKEQLVLVGDLKTKFGKKLLKKYKTHPEIRFLGGVYDKKILKVLRTGAKAYLHGHSVGGTNPSLLEAMASSCFVLAHNNQYNREVLEENALYFSTEEELSKQLKNFENLFRAGAGFVSNNLVHIREKYNWEKVTDMYLEHFNGLCSI